uniref:Uncharacterized protein n=1 Tax=Populus trichocarpa TaxID=3694 RepID=A0A3N7G8K5_POPTR
MVKHGERKRKSKRNSGGKVKLRELPAVFSLHPPEQSMLLKIEKGYNTHIYGGGRSHSLNSTPITHCCTCSCCTRQPGCCPWQPFFLSLFSHISLNSAFIYRLQWQHFLFFCQQWWPFFINGWCKFFDNPKLPPITHHCSLFL